jgi:uncharacterized protein
MQKQSAYTANIYNKGDNEMNDIGHFEIPADNPDRAAEFYRNLFGWRFSEIKVGDTTYRTVKTPGGIGGGLVTRQHPRQPWTNYVTVESVSEFLKKAVALGGEILLDKTAVKGMGFFAHFKDTEDNVVGLWEDDEKA